MFKGVLYVPSLDANLLSIYKRYILAHQSEWYLVLTQRRYHTSQLGRLVANLASKSNDFSHFLPYLDLVQSQMPFERGGKTILSTPFTYDNVSISVLDLEFEVEDLVESIDEIEDEVHSDPDPNPIPTPNPRPKWEQNFIDAIGNMTRDPSEIRRTRSLFQKENLVLC